MITRKKQKTTKTKLLGLIPDPLQVRKEALNKVKAVCAFTTSKSRARRDLLASLRKQRMVACEGKKGDIYVCGYTRKGKQVKGHCRKLPK